MLDTETLHKWRDGLRSINFWYVIFFFFLRIYGDLLLFLSILSLTYLSMLSLTYLSLGPYCYF